MSLDQKQKIFEEFAQFITAERREKIERNSRHRTRYVTAVLENIYQGHNISAVLRSSDCFGMQDVHIIEDKHRYNVNEDVAKGAAQWLTFHHYNPEEQESSTELCYKKLRAAGYAIAATTPHKNDMSIDQLPLDRKVALVFGTEQYGLSSYALENADYYVKIPMYGFTESFNISVCAGIAFYEVNRRLRQSDINWRLSNEELLDLQLEWLGRSTHRSDQILQRMTTSC